MENSKLLTAISLHSYFTCHEDINQGFSDKHLNLFPNVYLFGTFISHDLNSEVLVIANSILSEKNHSTTFFYKLSAEYE